MQSILRSCPSLTSVQTRVTRRLWSACMLAAAAATMAPGAWAQAGSYPSKPIVFVVPYAAGGSSDTRSRQLAKKMEDYLGQRVVVENRPGASGNIGTQAIATAKPDGYMIGLGNFAPMSVNQALYGKLAYDPKKDLEPIALLEKGPLVLGVSASAPYKTLAEFLAWSKRKPGGFSYASTGAGGASNLVAELFKDTAKFDAVHVPYRGGAPAINDIMGGSTDFMMDLASLFIPHATGDSPRIRILAVTAEKRLPALPDVPTFAELGYPTMNASNWFGVIAPKGVPPEVIAKLNEAVNRATQDPAYRKVVADQGAEVGGGTPANFSSFVETESQRWTKLIRDKGIKVD
ncbi:tripartite tricarboxylate transporter substrate binding protein [Ramlibacter tataouinensis]|uniref:Bug family tripartite tricarboxylate transporter substrate binding protein n=1 Tax=Ramlibacter tataouinensis TaxID=94132 RepID=UPI0022F3A5C7|nr:tripartite tricarboxylate transporter substrate binding protein [Ramlibacter tataouinensis]WBY01243.1 tripartite tricarboxylate transporter substrate binding protein [Ramlibacter tataouinensis]